MLKTAGSSTNMVASAVKVLEALQLLCGAEHPIPLAALAERLGVSAPTAYRVMQTLIHCGYAKPAAGGASGYRPTMEVVRLAGLITSRDPLTEITRNVFQRVSNQFGEPVTVGVPDGDHILFLQKLSGPTDPRFFCDVGKRLPYNTGAAGRCILAHLSDSFFEKYMQQEFAHRTPATHASEVSLREDRDHIRRHGYTVSVGEVDVGISAVGVPILNARGEVLAAAAIANITVRWNDLGIAQRAEAMTAAANEIMLQVADLRSDQASQGA